MPVVAKENHSLSGWYTESSLINKWEVDNLVRKNMTLYAGWNERQLSGIEIGVNPDKTQYIADDKLDITGLVVHARFDDLSTEIIDLSEVTVSGYDPKQIGEQVVTIEYKGYRTHFSINVIPKKLEQIEIISYPHKLQYIVGQTIELEGLLIEGIYNNGTREQIEISESDITGFNSSAPIEEQTVTVSVEEMTVTFIVKISEKQLTDLRLMSPPEKLSYYVGENLDLTGLVLTGEYNDESVSNVDLEEIQVSGFDSSRAATEQIVTLSVLNWKFEVKVNIISSIVHGVEVLAGANRYRTAVAISQASYEKSDVVILVQGNNFPDALAAGPLSYMMDAPILLTSTASLSSSLNEEMQRLETKTVIIMGGLGAVSAEVEDALIAEGYKVERVKGSSRYSTAVEAAKYMHGKQGNSDTVVLASGIQFADALAAGSYAAKEGYPILLTDGSRLSNATMEHITGSGVKNIILVGGTGVISLDLEDQLKTLGISITRKSGKNRFDTPLEIARSYFGNGEIAVVANGMNFADALAAAPYAAKMNAPIILVNQTRINLPIREYLPGSGISRIVVVGGDAAVNEAVRNELTDLIR